MKLFIVLVALIAVAQCCGFTRDDALNCVLKYGDTNKDGELTEEEIKHALDTLVPSYIKPVLWIKGVNAKRVLKDCDYDKNGILTPRDWEMSKKTCMPTQQNLCYFKFFCDRASKQKMRNKAE